MVDEISKILDVCLALIKVIESGEPILSRFLQYRNDRLKAQAMALKSEENDRCVRKSVVQHRRSRTPRSLRH